MFHTIAFQFHTCKTETPPIRSPHENNTTSTVTNHRIHQNHYLQAVDGSRPPPHTPAGPLEVEERARSSTHYLLYPPSHYPATYATLPRPAQHHHPASATNRSRAHPQAHTRSQREQRRHPAISHRNRCARTVKRPGGPVPALLQNSEIDLFPHSPFASRPQTHRVVAPPSGAPCGRDQYVVNLH